MPKTVRIKGPAPVWECPRGYRSLINGVWPTDEERIPGTAGGLGKGEVQVAIFRDEQL